MTIIDKLKRTGQRAVETVVGDDAAVERDVLAGLKQDHDDVAEMLDRLIDSRSGSERRALLGSIRRALVPHLRAEEKIVYDAVLAAPGKGPKEHAEEGYLEHSLADKTLASLFKIADPMSIEFGAGAKVLHDLVAHHVEEEETNIWADLRDHFSERQRIEMNRRFEAAKRRVRVPPAP